MNVHYIYYFLVDIVLLDVGGREAALNILTQNLFYHYEKTRN